jgi:hypothetical protein
VPTLLGFTPDLSSRPAILHPRIARSSRYKALPLATPTKVLDRHVDRQLTCAAAHRPARLLERESGSGKELAVGG